MTRAALTLLSGIATLLAAPAVNAVPALPDICGGTVSASQCRSEAFMNGPCYERHKAECTPIYAADYASQHASGAGTTEPRLVPESSKTFPPGTVLQTNVVPHDTSDDVQGAPGTYASFMYKMRYQSAKKPGAIKITRPISDAKGGILGEVVPAIGGAGGVAALPPAVQKLVANIFERMPTLVVDPRTQWEGNGNQIRSCEEYTYEKFYSFSKFEDLIAQEGYRVGIGHDRRAIFGALAGAVDGTGFIHPRGPGPNVSLTTADPPGPRNAFFARNLGALQPLNYYEWLRSIEQDYNLHPVAMTFGFDPDLTARVLAGHSVPGWTWAQHLTNGTGFYASTTDDQFARLDLYKDQYTGFLAEHDRLQQAVIACLGSTNGANLATIPAWCNTDLIHRDPAGGWTAPGPRHEADKADSVFDIAVAEGNISLALAHARDELHCLETGDPVACDWSPREFINRMLLEARSKEEEAYDRCLRFTGGDLTSPKSILTTLRDSPPEGYRGRITITEPPSGPGIDGTSSGDALEAVMFAFGEYVKTLGFDRDPTTGKIIVGQSAGDKQTVDGGDFGVELEYGAQWRVDNFDAASAIYPTDPPKGLCSSEGHAGGHAKLRGEVLGTWTDLFEASGSVDTDHLDGVVTADFSILGHSFYSVPAKHGTLAVDLAFEKSSTRGLAEARGIVPVLGVPVTLKAGATGTIGVKGGLSGTGGSSAIAISRHCPGEYAEDSVTLGVHGHFEPFVSVDGYASASIDLGFIEGGIKGEIQLARLGLPLDVELGMALVGQPQSPNLPDLPPPPPGPARLELYTKTSLALDFSTMDGHVSVFLETPFSSDEKTLVSWQGLHYRHNVFDRETHVPMSFLTTITNL